MPRVQQALSEDYLISPDYRRAFPDFSPTVYLNCAYQGPFPLRAVDRIKSATELKCHPERLESDEYFDLPERVRSRLARLTGADAGEIALTNSATQGIGIVVAGLDFRPGDEVVVASTNFPSNFLSWLHLRRRDVRVTVVVPRNGYIHAADVAAALTPRTRVLALDWVEYSTGVRIDLAEFGELAHQRGALFVVDGSQCVGTSPLDLHALPVDVLAAAGYKWLLGPYGTGFAYVSWNAQDLLDLPVVNWFSVEGSENFDDLPLGHVIDQVTLPKEARIFDVPETASFLNLYAFEASLEFVEEAGFANVDKHCARLIERLIRGLRDRRCTCSAAAEPARRSAILGFQAGSMQATWAVFERLKAHHISVSLRHGMIRVSPYLYNDEKDVDALLGAVQDIKEAAQ